MGKCQVISHPLIQHKLSILRRQTTSTKDFRELVNEIAMLMGYEVSRDLPLEDVDIQTPVSKTVQKQLAGKKLAIVPILRAGIGMVDGLLSLVPAAKVSISACTVMKKPLNLLNTSLNYQKILTNDKFSLLIQCWQQVARLS